jgi:hypothetical protein
VPGTYDAAAAVVELAEVKRSASVRTFRWQRLQHPVRVRKDEVRVVPVFDEILPGGQMYESQAGAPVARRSKAAPGIVIIP